MWPSILLTCKENVHLHYPHRTENPLNSNLYQLTPLPISAVETTLTANPKARQSNQSANYKTA